MNTRDALLLVLDNVDWTANNCSMREMVGAVLSREVIELARGALAIRPPEADYADRVVLVESMRKWGGGFVQALAESVLYSDVDNFARLLSAFPEILSKYLTLAREKE